MPQPDEVKAGQQEQEDYPDLLISQFNVQKCSYNLEESESSGSLLSLQGGWLGGRAGGRGGWQRWFTALQVWFPCPQEPHLTFGRQKVLGISMLRHCPHRLLIEGPGVILQGLRASTPRQALRRGAHHTVVDHVVALKVSQEKGRGRPLQHMMMTANSFFQIPLFLGICYQQRTLGYAPLSGEGCLGPFCGVIGHSCQLSMDS